MLAIFERLSWVQRVTIAVLGAAAAVLLVLEGLAAETVPTAVGVVLCGALPLAALFAPGLMVPAAVLSLAFTIICSQLDAGLDNTFGIVELVAFSWLVVRVVMLQPLRRTAWTVPLLLVTMAVLPLRLDASSDGYKAVMVAATMAGVAFMVLLGLYLRLHEQRRADGFAMARQAQRLEYARDLHDFVAHHVTAIVAQTKAVRYTTAAGLPPSAEALDSMLAGIERAGSEALVSMRGMITVLRGNESPPEQRTLGDVLQTTLNQFAGPVTASVEDGLAGRWLPQHTLDTVHHVVQESLTNVLRHATNVSRVEVSAQLRDGQLEISVTNNGTAGATTLPSGGFGLTGLTERVEGAGGHLSAGPADPGWQVVATLPSTALTSSTA
jgi:signal transduction histidine kinase